MLNNLDDLKRLITERGIAMLDLKYSDLFGGWHHITLPASHVASEPDGMLEEGIGFDSSSTPGYKSLEAGDMVLLPDPRTAFMDPFWDLPTLSMICNIAEADSKKRFDRDPRFIAQKAEEYLIGTGIADRSRWGPEFEFYVFPLAQGDDAGDTPSPNAGAGLGARSPLVASSQLCGAGGYHAIPPQDQCHNLRSEIAKLLGDAGIEVRYHHHEVGCPSQQEIEVVLGPLTRMGDVAMMVKYFVRMTAIPHNLTATFMPKPLYGQAGSGMHFHQHLFKGNTPLFYDPKGYAGLSDLALSYVAGVLLHGPALLAFTNPSTNSYKRLIPGYEAPVNLFFSLANRSAAIRIPKYTETPAQKRIEFRPPDATCNPYLAMAAMLMAGLDGIKRKADPRELGFGPFDQNLFASENDHLKTQIRRLPTSLDEALEALSRDHDFLHEGEVFPSKLIETWIHYKQDKEVREVRNRPHPVEFQLYYNC